AVVPALGGVRDGPARRVLGVIVAVDEARRNDAARAGEDRRVRVARGARAARARARDLARAVDEELALHDAVRRQERSLDQEPRGPLLRPRARARGGAAAVALRSPVHGRATVVVPGRASVRRSPGRRGAAAASDENEAREEGHGAHGAAVLARETRSG